MPRRARARPEGPRKTSRRGRPGSRQGQGSGDSQPRLRGGARSWHTWDRSPRGYRAAARPGQEQGSGGSQPCPRGVPGVVPGSPGLSRHGDSASTGTPVQEQGPGSGHSGIPPRSPWAGQRNGGDRQPGSRAASRGNRSPKRPSGCVDSALVDWSPPRPSPPGTGKTSSGSYHNLSSRQGPREPRQAFEQSQGARERPWPRSCAPSGG